MGRFLALILGIAGALVASQGPEFTAHYMQNLNGRVAELETIVERFDSDIANFGYTREQAIEQCKLATDLFDALCSSYRSAIERYTYLKTHLAALSSVEDHVRPLILARSYDPEIAEAVRENYEPAVPTTLNGGLYAAGGFVVFWGLPLFLFSILGAMFGGRR